MVGVTRKCKHCGESVADVNGKWRNLFAEGRQDACSGNNAGPHEPED